MSKRQQAQANHSTGVKSTASVAGHPIHPVLIPFPIAFLTGALLTDIAYLSTGDAFWARVSLWLIGVGLVTGILAGAVGAVDYFTIERVRDHSAGNIHAIGNVIVVILAAINLFVRWGDAGAAIAWWGLILSLITAAALGITGWYGGELSYRHKVGVTGHE